MTSRSEAFDAEYYQRFYVDDPVHDAARLGSLMDGIFGLARWWDIELTSVLDIGAGVGLAGNWLKVNEPKVRYRGVDISRHACRTYGHMYADISKWKPRSASDLVLCISVLQYLDDEGFLTAAENLAAATGKLLFLELPTSRDRRTVIDASRTDLNVKWRSGAWYKRALHPHFRFVGAGLWVRRSLELPLYELEGAQR